MSPLSLSLQGYNGQKGMFGEKGIPGIAGPRVSHIAFECLFHEDDLQFRIIPIIFVFCFPLC